MSRPRSTKPIDTSPAYVAAEGRACVNLWSRYLWREFCEDKTYLAAGLAVGVDTRTAQQWATGERAPAPATVARMAPTGIAIMRIEVKP